MNAIQNSWLKWIILIVVIILLIISGYFLIFEFNMGDHALSKEGATSPAISRVQGAGRLQPPHYHPDPRVPEILC